jgi:phosphoribosylaminoimidazole-succinocarboxamide synthase
MTQTLYRGSVKDLKGPLRASVGGEEIPAVVFEYTDAYSVFDWGRMPDALERKGEALAVLAADWFEKLERPDTWKEFSRSPEALGLRKGNRFGAAFNELGEELQARGLRTHYLGMVAGTPASGDRVDPVPCARMSKPSRTIAVRQVSVVKPVVTSVLGRQLPDYHGTRNAPLPRLVPLEVVFRFALPEGSSLFERLERDPGYLASLGFGGLKAEPGGRWEFPLLELFTKLESSDRPVPLTEGLSISGLSAPMLQELLFRTAWVAGCIRWLCAKAGLELADGKLEWALDAQGKLILVDAIGPDELRILKNGLQLSKEFLRRHYRASQWYESLVAAKEQAKAQGNADWKKGVAQPPPPLPPMKRELASQVYLALANALTGRQWFADAWTLERAVSELRGS